MDNSGRINYENSGVSINTANDTKSQFKDIVSSKTLSHCKPLNRVGAFASLVEINLKDYENPVFVLKSEEPGSKQMISIDNNRFEWIARDLINHLINDIIVMGAVPCAVLDTIICGKFEKETVLKLVGGISKACEENGCVLVGGETSEQPGMLPGGRYVLQASVLGIAEKSKIIDGTGIECGNTLIALPSNGLHTNGYSLVRKLMEIKPEIINEKINGENFLDAILKPHLSYFKAAGAAIQKYRADIRAMAHITGGGIHDNLERVINGENLQAVIDLSSVKVLPVFNVIKKYANTSDDEMLAAFNNGVGMIAAVSGSKTNEVIDALKAEGVGAYPIGQIEKSAGGGSGGKKVVFKNKLRWQ